MTIQAMFALVVGTLLGGMGLVETKSHWSRHRQASCVPIDSAWALSGTVLDADTRQPVSDARIWNDSSSDGRWTEEDGRACLRSLNAGTQTLAVSRRGYQPEESRVSGIPGQTVEATFLMRRVRSPCCTLRGEWHVTLNLSSAARLQPRPAGHVTSGTISLGPRVHRPIEGDFLDSLVHIERGLHSIDLRPFFGGPVARDVSTSVFGGGPDLYREVEASIPMGSEVSITLIPRMSHGSISLRGAIANDTIRGSWRHNAFSGGATGTFVMHRPALPDTTGDGAIEPTPNLTLRRLKRGAPAPSAPAGRTPALRWSPTLGLSDSGSLVYAVGGIYLADSIGSAWTRILGGDEDPVDGDDAGLGLASIVFVGEDTLLAGWDMRRRVASAPHMYRSIDRGRTWSALPLPAPGRVRFIEAFGSSVWLVQQMEDERWEYALFASDDAGATWERRSMPVRVSLPSRLTRLGPAEAYLTANPRDRSPALLHTTDGGLTWRAIPTPADQGLQKVNTLYARVGAVALLGDTLVVQEYRRVFVTPRNRIRWTQVEGWAHLAGDPSRAEIFVIDTVGRPALLDRQLRVVWQASQSIVYDTVGTVMEVHYRAGTGLIRGATGALVAVRRDDFRVLLPLEFRPPQRRIDPTSREP